MFDIPFDFFSLVIAIVAFIFARKAFNQAAMLRARLDAIEATASETGPATAHPATGASADPGSLIARHCTRTTGSGCRS